MSKIFRRPMFRKGGNVGEGIMTGIVDRGNYEVGGSASERLMKVMQDYPVQTVDPVSQLLIQGGLSGLSTAGKGGTIANLASAFEPATQKFFENVGAQDKAKRDLALAGEQLDIEQDYAKDIAKIKATTESGFLKEETAQRAYEDLVKTRTAELGALKTFEKPNANQRFARQTAEYDIIIKRNLRNSKNPDAQEISQNDYGLVPFDVKSQEFDFTNIVPGGYYYYPEEKVFVQRVPATDKDSGGLFKINPYTFQRVKVPENNR